MGTNLVPLSDGSSSLGTTLKRWSSIAVTGDITDGTNDVDVSELKAAYTHSLTTAGNPHSVTAVEVAADPLGTAASEMGVHEATYDHSNIIEADPVNSSANAITAHTSLYNHSNIGNAVKIQSRDISSSAPSDGEVLTWDTVNNQWEPGSGGALTSVSTDTSIDGDGTAGDPLTVVDGGHDHTLADVTDSGTAATKDFPAIGDAGATEVVIGTDSRLTDARTAAAHAINHVAGGGDQVNHDTLYNFAANEHIDHSAVNIVAGYGISGGGYITSSVNLAVDQTDMSESFILDVGDETTDITVGVDKKTFRMPYDFVLTDVRASLTTAPVVVQESSSSSSSSYLPANFTVDINKTGTTILSTKLTIDSGEYTSTTAAIPVVVSVPTLQDDTEISIDVDVVGNSVAGAGLKITLIGYRGL